MNLFWRTWLDIWCWIVVGFGAVMVLGAWQATDSLTRFLYDLFYWPLDGRDGFGDATRLTCGVLGAVTLGWGLTLRPLVALGHEVGGRVWRPVSVGLLAWYCIDSAISVALGAAGNAVSNTLLLFGFFLPFIATGTLRDALSRTQRAAAKSSASQSSASLF
jgi:hypothetical protein